METIIAPERITHINQQFLVDVLHGLNSTPKKLDSKYFYDKQGDKLFQEIMASDEYYLTNCEMEILTLQSAEIAKTITGSGLPIDLIELGAGDATKSIHLLKQLLQNEINFNYLPIDISSNVISHLENELPKQLPQLNIRGFIGDYFNRLEKAVNFSDNKKVVLFMGANIGNMLPKEAAAFLAKLRSYLTSGDLLLVGFDLKKNPKQILAAYNDEAGITRRFNLNLLKRINTELNADFNLSSFEHFANYDPKTGACKSYLISLENQSVEIGSNTIYFKKNEYIDMEISQKYSEKEISELMTSAGLTPKLNFLDSKGYFVDAIWELR